MNSPPTEMNQDSCRESLPVLCPVTQLPITQKPEWIDIRLSSDFSATYSLIGENIVLCRFIGHVSREAAQKGIQVRRNIISEMMPGKRPYIFIVDLSAMRGFTVEARFYYTHTLKKNPDGQMKGMIFFGASAFMRVSTKLGIRMNSQFNVKLKKDYAEAVQTAQGMLQSRVRNRSQSPVGSSWELQLKGLFTRYELIEEDAIHLSASGYLDESHIEPLRDMREKIADELGRNRDHFFVILNLAGFAGSNFNARRIFIRQIRNFFVPHLKPTYIIYGVGPMHRTVINLSSALLPFRILHVKDYDAALNLLAKEKSRRLGSAMPAQSDAGKAVQAHPDQIQQYVDELLDYLGNINWEGTGFYNQMQTIHPRHPFKSVFDAISLIKTEIDLLFQERKGAEEELRESEEKFKSLSQNTPDIIYTLDTDGAFTYVNPTWESILGHKRKDVVGRHFTDFTEEETRGQVVQPAQILNQKEIVRDKSVTLLHRDGTPRLFNMSGAPNFNSSGQLIGVVGILKDITEHRRLETQFQQAQKMEAIGTLAGGIAHDFNNLLMGIQGYVSLLLLKKDPGDPDFQKLKSIEQQVQSGADLTRQLLGFARAGQYQVRPTDLNELIAKSAGMFGRTKREIQIHEKLQSDLWTVEVDQGQIEQVMLNLYINAWQAMPAGGELFLSTQNITLDNTYISALDIKPGNYVKITVTDTGIGMDEKVRKRIFEPFFTTKEMGRGTGLGLASAYGIVKGHGGMINVYSEKGHGTTFTIYIPASEKARPADAPKFEKVLKGTETILVVDDESIVLTVSREILEVLGYTVLVAGNGRDALDLYVARNGSIDLVILDMIMPEMSGWEVFSELKKLNPEIKVILSSGYSINGEATKIMRAGCKAFIQKPFSLKHLSQQVRSVIDAP